MLAVPLVTDGYFRVARCQLLPERFGRATGNLCRWAMGYLQLQRHKHFKTKVAGRRGNAGRRGGTLADLTESSLRVAVFVASGTRP